MLTVTAIPAFTDNYLWLLSQGAAAVVVDPGDAQPVLSMLRERGLRLEAILITHHHPDHIGGIAALLREFPVPVYGPRAEAGRIRNLTQLLADNDTVTVLGQPFQVMAVPGHTLGHIAYYAPGLLFCGDTLFSAGCGRLFEGTAQQMHASLSRLAALPGDTRVYCTHEYTLSNLAFAVTVEPQNAAAIAHLSAVRQLRAHNKPSLPSSIALELGINPFLRTGTPGVNAAASTWCGRALGSTQEVFAELRRWKDGFRAPVAP